MSQSNPSSEQRTRFRARVVRNTAYGVMGRILGIAVALVLLPVILTHLGDERYALYALASSLTGYIALLDLGMGTGYVKFVAEAAARTDDDAVNEVLSTGVFSYLAFGGVVLALWFSCRGWFLDFLSITPAFRDEAAHTFTIAVVVVALSGAAAAFRAVLYGLQRIDVATRVGLILVIPRVALILLALHAGLGPVGLALVDLTTFLAGTVVMAVSARTLFPSLEIHPRRCSRATFRRMFHFGVRLQVSRLSEMVNFHFDKLLLSRFVGLTSVTQYELGGRLSQTTRSFPLMMLDALVPAISDLDARDERAAVRRITTRALRYLLVVALPAFTLLAVVADHFLEAWLGSPRPDAALVVRVLAGGYLLNVLSGAYTTACQGLGRTDYQMRVALVSLSTNVVASTLLVYWLGLRGVVAGTTLAFLVAFVYAHFTFDSIEVVGPSEIRDGWRRRLAPWLATLAAFGAAVALDFVVDWPDERLSQFMHVSAQATAFGVAYVGSLIAFGGVSDADRSLAADLLRRRWR